MKKILLSNNYVLPKFLISTLIALYLILNPSKVYAEISLTEINGIAESTSGTLCNAWQSYITNIAAMISKYSILELNIVTQKDFMYNATLLTCSDNNNDSSSPLDDLANIL